MNKKNVVFLTTAGLVFLTTFLAVADATFWEDVLGEWVWWILGFAQAGMLWWAGRILLTSFTSPLTHVTGLIALGSALGSLTLLVMLLIVELWVELNDAFVDIVWGIVGIAALFVAFMLVIISAGSSQKKV